MQRFSGEDRVGWVKDNISSSMGELCDLGCMVDTYTVAVQPWHAQDHPDAFERQDSKGDVSFVLAINLNCNQLGSVSNRKQGAFHEAGRGRVLERDEFNS